MEVNTPPAARPAPPRAPVEPTVHVHPDHPTGTLTTYPDAPKRKFPAQPSKPAVPAQAPARKSVPAKKPWFVVR